MTRRLVIVMTLLAAGVALALAVPMGIIISKDQHSAFISQLQVDTLSTSVALSSQPQTQWADTADKVGTKTGARVVVVDVNSKLLADSDLSAVDRTFNRPEIVQALAGTVTSNVRPSATLGTDLRYVAAPVVKLGKVVAAVRLALPEFEVTNVVRQSQFALSVFVIAVMLFAALIAWLIARSIAAPLSRVAGVAEQLPDDLSLRADEHDGPVEVQAVSRALNITAARLTGILERTRAVAADASHHLKTPLTGVRLRLEAIEDIS
ncbi:MAG: HAMP domain-containing protein, partial [Actinobacteria bacterium]|nr:HAMP domain-containing protein [Actinomycetota bacterium]